MPKNWVEFSLDVNALRAMTAPAQLAYGIAAACFAVALHKSSEVEWWQQHRTVAFLIGASIPICILAAWLSETPMREASFWGIHFMPHRPEALVIAAWVGIAVGLIALTAFLLTISVYLAAGFLIGGLLLAQFIDMTTPRSSSKPPMEQRSIESEK